VPLPDPQFARSEVLRVFNHAQIYLFLGASIITVGLLSVFFSLLRRRVDSLLLWFALFAALYGLRLEMNYQLLWALYLRPPILQRIVIAIGFLVPIPAFFFFRALDLLGRVGKIVTTCTWPILSFLALATVLAGPRDIFRYINNIVVIAAFIVVVFALVRMAPGSSDVRLIRRGLFVFIAFAIYDNVTMFIGRYDNIEPFSFVFLLACLGVVAGRRALANENQLLLIQKELDIARQIQISILPASFSDSKSFRIAARYLPMTSVAGDFYDFLIADDQQVGILVADVAGHGVPAALIASMVKVAATGQLLNVARPSELLGGMNASLCGNTQNQFVTAAYVYLDASANELRYSAAAHPAMLLLRKGEVVSITENGLMLAAFNFAAYTTLTYPLKRGDRILLYTDGVLEATNAAGEEFGDHRLTVLLKETATLTNRETADRIIETIRDWSVSQGDDLTVLVCDYLA